MQSPTVGIMITILFIVFILFRKIKKAASWRSIPQPLIYILMLLKTSQLLRKIAIGLVTIILGALLTLIFTHLHLITKALHGATPFIGHINVLFLLWGSIGVILGLGLAILSSKWTKIESRNHVWYYRPNPFLGTIVVMLVLVRIIIKLTHLYHLYNVEKGQHFTASNLQHFNWQSQVSTSASDTWTSLIFAMFISYFVFVVWKVLSLNKQAN